MSSEFFTIETFGGLGNQLFQYALGRRLSLDNQTDVHFDTWWHGASGNRPFQLGFLSANYASDLSRSSPRLARTRLRLAFRQPGLLARLSPDTVTEKGLPFRPQVLEARPGSRLIGYFQSWHYFANSLPRVRHEIMSNAPKSDWVTGASHGFPLDQDAIAIHLRRGDYSTRRARRYHGVLDKEYYQRALKALNPSPNARYFVFSDAPEAQLLVKELVGDRSHVETVKEPQGSTPLDAMLFLASFSKVICANSTFSWWAAFLGTHDDKDVVVPANWFRSKPTCKECLFLPAWKPI